MIFRYGGILASGQDNSIQSEVDLAAILDLEKREGLGVFQELDKVNHLIEWLAPEGEARKRGFGLVPMPVSHAFLRYLKATGILYLKKLRQDRERVASRPNVSKHTVEDIDRRLAALAENYPRSPPQGELVFDQDGGRDDWPDMDQTAGGGDETWG